MSHLPVACELSPADLETRKASLLAGLRARSSAIAAIENGLRLTFAQGMGPVELEITGPPGTTEFRASVFTDPR